jgi:hypothetical protein
MDSDIIIFENYEKFFKRVDKYSFVPLLTPENLYKSIDILHHHTIKRYCCHVNTLNSSKKKYDKYSMFQFIIYFIKKEYFLEYFTKFPKEAIKIDKIDKYKLNYQIDLIQILVCLIEDYGIENDNDFDEDDEENEIERIKNGEIMILEAIKHAYEVWNFPLTFNSLIESFNFELNEIVKYILTNKPELIYEKKDGKNLLNIFDNEFKKENRIRCEILKYQKQKTK